MLKVHLRFRVLSDKLHDQQGSEEYLTKRIISEL